MSSKGLSPPLALQLGLRGLLSSSGRRNHSMPIASLAIAVAVLVATLSVVNGFDQVLRERLLALVPQVTLSAERPLAEWGELLNALDQQIGNELLTAEPVVYLPAMLSAHNRTTAALVQGLRHGSATQGGLTAYLELDGGDAPALGNDGIVLGDALAQQLKIALGEVVTVLHGSGSGRALQGSRFTVRALINSGTSMDLGLALIDFERGAELLRHPGMASAIQLRLTEPLDAPQVASRLKATLGSGYRVEHWIDRFGSLFDAISLSKQLIALLLAAVMIIAVFNISAMLSVLSSHRRAQIALLRTLGAPPHLILHSVIVQGVAIGTIGITLGTLLGILLSLLLDDAALALEHYFGFSVLTEGSYPLDHLPTAINWSELIGVYALAMLLCIVASLYPAWRAAKLPPSVALR